MGTSLSVALGADASLGAVLDGLSRAIVTIAAFARRPRTTARSEHEIDQLAHGITVGALTPCPVAAIGSEEAAEPVVLDPRAPWVVAVDPLDGSNNVNLNAPIGFIFAVLPNTGQPASALLQPGTELVAAGVAVLGPATTLLASVGRGAHLLTLDPDAPLGPTGGAPPTDGGGRGEAWTLTRTHLTIPEASAIYAINGSNQRHWSEPYRAYHRDLLAGVDGPRARNFNTRWLAALVAEAQRIFLDGGIYLYPGDQRPGYAEGRLRLVYEANPIAFLCREAGGAATNGEEDILGLVPSSLHQHTPLVFGSANEVELVSHYLGHDPVQGSPLFGRRGLFRSA